jgi:uncharacterized protein with NRDE domain
MCLIIFAFQHHEKYPLIVCSNRDEFYNRPTLAAQPWPENPQIFAGQDLQAGGTWLGLNLNGRFAAITNYRSNSTPPPTAISRGTLCSDFLNSSMEARDYLARIDNNRERYAGFNLLVGSSKELLYYSSSQSKVVTIKPGVHGLSNGFLNEEWPKLKSGKIAMTKLLKHSTDQQRLFEILQDRRQADNPHLPDTGINKNLERLLSSRFIKSPEYGTRNSTVLMINKKHEAQWLEQNFDNNGPIAEATYRNFQLNH